MRPLVLLVLIAAPSMARAEWNVDSRTDESPPYHAVSQDSRPAGLTLGFWCREGAPRAVSLGSGRPLTAVYPGTLGGLLQSLRGACHAAE